MTAALDLVRDALGDKTFTALGLTDGNSLTFNKILSADILGNAPYWNNLINLNLSPYHYERYVDITIHEIGHIVDAHASSAGPNTLWSLTSGAWREATGWWYHQRLHMWILPITGKAGAATTYLNSPREDFAETFTWYVDGGKYSQQSTRPYSRPSLQRREALKVALEQIP